MLEDIAREIYYIAEAAGQVVSEWKLKQAQMTISEKLDGSPVTEADLLANQVIIDGLEKLSLDEHYPILSEETDVLPYETRCHWKRYWCIDPLDGTKSFIAGSDEYTINIALIDNYHPIIGAVYVPDQQCGYFAAKGGQAYKVDQNKNIQVIHTRSMNSDHFKVAISRFATSKKLIEGLKAFPGATLEQMSSSLKLCKIAEGKIDCYPRLTPASEWDLAAAQVILEVAGGTMFDMTFNPIMYNNKSSILQPAFLAVGESAFDWKPFVELMIK